MILIGAVLGRRVFGVFSGLGIAGYLGQLLPHVQGQPGDPVRVVADRACDHLAGHDLAAARGGMVSALAWTPAGGIEGVD